MPTVTIQSPKVARQQMAALLEEIDTFVQVFDHMPKDPGGVSPFATVHGTGGSEFENLSAQLHQQAFLVTIYWRRDDADATEDNIDDLYALVVAKLMENSSTNAYWKQLLVLLDPDDAGTTLIDGTQYRWRQIPVTALVLCT